MKTLRSFVLVQLAVLAFGAAAPALAQVPLDNSLDDHSAKRLDRMEQAIRELRAIVFQGRETGKPVVVEPADTDAQLSALSQKIDDLQQAITRLTGQLELAGHDVDEARHEADAAARGERRPDRPRRRAGAEARRPGRRPPPPAAGGRGRAAAAAGSIAPAAPGRRPRSLQRRRLRRRRGRLPGRRRPLRRHAARHGGALLPRQDSAEARRLRRRGGHRPRRRAAMAGDRLGARRGARPRPGHGRHEGEPRGLRRAERDRHPLPEGGRGGAQPASTRCGARRGARRADGRHPRRSTSCRASIAG